MILCIGDVLTPDELTLIAEKLKTAEFADGKLTAGWHARLVKQNTQLPKESPALKALRSLIDIALRRNRLFQMAA